MAQDQHLLWTTKGTQAALQDQDYLDPYSLYDFFSTANAARVHRGRHGARVKSATPRIGGRNPSSIRSGLTIDSSLRNPSPTPATSRPLSARSGKSAFSSTPPSIKINAPSFTQSPTSLYLGFQKARCKSAPPRPVGYYLPRRPKTAKSQASTSGVSSVRSAPKRAWQNRTSSTKDCHSLLSPEEVNQRHNERCKSAPVPYDFSSIEIVTSVSEQSSDIQRLRALTRPLNCMPEVVKNVLSSNALRHCCSAYHPRPKTSPSTRRQFWPVTRPAVFHRGDVPKYLHFVKPAGYWTRGNADYQQTPASGDDLTRTGDSNAYNVPDLTRTGDSNAYNVSGETNLSMHGSDIMQETVLYEDQFLVSATLSEASLSDQENWPEFEVDGELQADEDLDAIPSGDLATVANKFLGDKEGEEEISPEETRPVPRLPIEKLQSDNKITQPEEHGFQITITKADPLPVQDPVDQADQLTVQDPTPDYEVMQQEEIELRDDHKETAETDAGFGIVVSEMPQGIGAQSGNKTDEEHNNEVLLQEELKPEPSPEPVLEEPSAPASDHDPVEEDEQKQSTETPRVSSEPELKSQVSQVKFSESLILTSFKSPEPREEKKELPVKPILKPTVIKQEVLPPVSEKPKLLQKEVSKEKVPATPLPKPQAKIQDEEAKPHKDLEEKKQVYVQEEKKEESPKLEAKVLPQPEFIRAPGAYKMYDPKDLLQFKVEQHRDTRADKKSLSAPPMPHFVPSAESTVVMTSILDDQKRVKEGMKPWLQGRLALSRQTSRFELPMDVRLLEAMTPMEYLTKYCIISTRRKALYKHIFQKVDRDRDNLITFKEMDKGLKDIHVDYINTEQVKKLIEMVESNEKSTFNLAQFSAIAAFSERLLFSESQVSERNSVYSSKEIIEEADFCGLKFKLSGFLVNPTVRKILEVL